MENNKMVRFQEIVDNCFEKYDVYIPLIQRNYKWDKSTAAKLARDLWDAFNKSKNGKYTVGMITFYEEKDEESKKKMQLVDGQQRIITLFMLLKYIMPEKDYFTFRFERDEVNETNFISRQSYLTNINYYINSSDSCEKEKENMYTDLDRFKNNYEEMKNVLEEKMKNVLEENDKSEFAEYIMNHVYFLLHISEIEPFDEFININKNKTRFVISDKIKANLIIDSKEKKEKEDVLKLFQELSEILFSKKDIWELVKQGYCETEIPKDNDKRKKNKHYPDENRLKLLCCERYGENEYDGSSTFGYEFEKEKKYLFWYKDILKSLLEDIKNNNWNSYNAFNCLHKLNNDELRFFKMLKEIDNKEEKKKLEKYLLDECKKTKDQFVEACFIESQLENGKSDLKYIDNHKHIREEFNNNEQELWLNNSIDQFETFEQIYRIYIREKYNK